MKKVLSEEEVKKCEELRINLIEKMKIFEVDCGELSEYSGISLGSISKYRMGYVKLTPKTSKRLIKSLDEIVKHRNKPKGPISISVEEIQRRLDRKSILNEEMSKNNISNKELATHAKMDKSTIEKYRDGSYSITYSCWDILTTAIESIRLVRKDRSCTNINNPVIIEKRCNHSTKHVEAYIFRNIEEKGNALISKKKYKGHESQILKDLLDYGFECTARKLNDGDYVIERINKDA